MTDEREDWQALIDSPGFQRLQAYAKADMDRHMEAALNDVESEVALNRLRQVVASKKVVDRVLRYPAERLKALAPSEAVPVGYARGGL